MSHQDPPRLKLLSDTPDELQDALRALSHEDPARLARVAQKLGPLLDAAPPASTSAGFWSSTGKLWANKLLIAGITLGAATLWLTLRNGPQHRLSAHEVAVPGIMKAEREEPVAPSATGAVTLVPMASSLEAADPATEFETERVPSNRAERRRPARMRGANVLPRGEQPSPAEPVARAPQVTAQVDSVEEEHAVEAPAAKEPPPPVVQLRTEEELLFEARSQLTREPKIALRLLDEHKSRFEKGLLAPEREVMAIETLRRLGRSQEADRRLATFRAQHPDSLHLKRLLRATP